MIFNLNNLGEDKEMEEKSEMIKNIERKMRNFTRSLFVVFFGIFTYKVAWGSFLSNEMSKKEALISTGFVGSIFVAATIYVVVNWKK